MGEYKMTEPDPSQWLYDTAALDPDKPFLVEDNRTLSYSAFSRLVNQQARALLELNVAPGDRVASQAEKSAEALAVYLACLRLGAIFMPLNTGYTPAEIDYFVEDAEPRLFIVDPSNESLGERLPGSTRLETLGTRQNGSFWEKAACCSAEPLNLDASKNRPAAMLYTSGTTGRPKGAVLSLNALASNAQTLAEVWRFTGDDVLLHVLPIFHAHGLFVATNTLLAVGATMLFQPKFEVRKCLELLPGATTMMGVPTFYTRLLAESDFDKSATEKMRLFISGSAPLLAETHKEFEERTGHAILERYGMTETLMNTSNPYEGPRVPGSVGPALPGVEVRVTDPESGAILSGDAIGMLEVRGPNLFDGYWRNPKKTAEDMRDDGFFITGDLGKIDEKGFVYIVGRSKDLVISGGYNVYPKEVETEIDALPGINESAVIGVPHPDFGEAVVAVVTSCPDADVDQEELRSLLRDRLAAYKIPKSVIVIDELPRNTMGKVQKNLLRQNYADLYNGSQRK